MLTSQLQLLGASPTLSFCTQSNSASQLPGYRPHRVQTTSNLFLNIQFHIIAPPGALTLLPPNLAPRVHPKQKKKKKKLNPDPCSSPVGGGLGQEALPQVPAGRRAEPSAPREQGSSSSDKREHAGRSRSRDLSVGRKSGKGGHCLRSPGVWSSRDARGSFRAAGACPWLANALTAHGTASPAHHTGLCLG